MRAAVIGAGFSGLALCWHLLERGISVDLYDQKGIGAGASGVASGLLHPYAGEGLKRSWRADLALKESRDLLEIAQCFSSEKVADFSGLIRKTTEEQAKTMLKHALVYEDVELLSENVFLIKSGIAVFSEAYLEGLYRACLAKSMKFKIQRIGSYTELESYDFSFFAIGAGFFSGFGAEELKLKPVKGQSFVCSWPSHLPPLERGILEKGHVVPLKGGDVHLGSTYERGILDESPDCDKALLDLAPKARVLIPGWEEITVKECRTGIRIAHTGHYFPLLKKIEDKVWVMTALGSRGLLYHGYGAKILVESAVLDVDPNLILFKNKPFSYDCL